MRCKLAASMVLTAMLVPARAQAEELRMFGHALSILKIAEGNEALSIDGRQIHSNYYVSLDEVAVVAGVPVAIGTSSAGGNACEGAPFIISFPAGKAPRFDGPLDSCLPVSVNVQADRITLSTAAQASAPGERWKWTVAGIVPEAPIAFSADSSKSWDDLRAREIDHPAGLLSYGEVTDTLNRLLGPDRTYVARILEGVGSVEYRSNFLIGTVCQAHACGYVEAFVAADIGAHAMYVAWKPEDAKIVVRPAVDEWPATARQALKQWAAKWK